MLASGWADFATSSAASDISKSPKSDPPAIESNAPCAPSIDASSNGLEIANSAARIDLASPLAELRY